MPSSTFRIATIRGIDVRVSPSWLLVAAAVVWSYQRSFATGGHPLLVTLTMALATALLFTLSVLLHELAHALEGAHRGIEVGGITLFLLGGATSLRDPDRRAVDEFAVAAVGPWSNVVLAAVFGLLAMYAGSWDLRPVAEVAGVLGWLNLGLAVFNLIPGAPLDGGRVLRAAVWAVTRDRHRSTVVAAWVGITLGFCLVAVALWLVAMRDALWVGLWAGVIGGYVLRAARMELARGRLAMWLSGFTAADLAPATAIAHATPLEELPVVAHDDPGDRLVGLLDRDQPLVLLTSPDGTWLSTLQTIDQRIQELRGGEPERGEA